MFARLRELSERVWLADLRRQEGLAWLRLAAARVVLHAWGNFSRHLLGIRAAGLTLVSLLALVPVLTLLFGVAEAFSLRGVLDQALDQQAEGMPAYVGEFLVRLRELVAETNFKTMGWLSFLILAWSGLALFGTIETALNSAWQSRRRRAWFRRASDFIALIVCVPLLALAAVALQSFTHGGVLSESFRIDYPILAAIYDAGHGLVPYGMAWLAFTALYKFMPNARVRWSSAAIGGAIAGTAVLWMNSVYLAGQIGVARANAIYATFAAVPLLLVYLHLAWTIVLLGAEVCYAVQNVETLGNGRRVRSASWLLRERVGLWLTWRVCSRYESGQGPLEIAAEAAALDIPGEVIDSVAQQLVEAGVLLEVGDEGALVPSRPPEQLDLDTVLGALRGDLPGGVLERMRLPERLESGLEAAATEARAAITGVAMRAL